jgi:hypothetical protein
VTTSWLVLARKRRYFGAAAETCTEAERISSYASCLTILKNHIWRETRPAIGSAPTSKQIGRSESQLLVSRVTGNLKIYFTGKRESGSSGAVDVPLNNFLPSRSWHTKIRPFGLHRKLELQSVPAKEVSLLHYSELPPRPSPLHIRLTRTYSPHTIERRKMPQGWTRTRS